MWHGGLVGKRGEELDLVPNQHIYLVLHAFHWHSIFSLAQLSTSENEIEQTSWCSINSSNVLHILMVKDRFTFESKVTNMVVSELVISKESFHL
jgi:hypothetical protein